MSQLALAKRGLVGLERFIKRKNNQLFLMSLPFVVFVFAFFYVPLFGWIFAFYRYVPGLSLLQCDFVGLENFRFLLDDMDIVRVLKNTLVMSFLSIAASPLPIVLAIMLTEVRSGFFKKVVQSTTTLPHFVSWVIVYSVAFSLFSSEGVVNVILSRLNISDSSVNVLGNNRMIWYIMEAIRLWKGLGWSAIVYLAAISGIDSELYDAASVDGANRFQLIWHITIPGIMPTYVVLLLLHISRLLDSGLDQYLMFYNSLVAENIEVLDYYVYRMGIILGDYSYGTAVGMLKSLVAIALLFTTNAIAKRVRGQSII